MTDELLGKLNSVVEYDANAVNPLILIKGNSRGLNDENSPDVSDRQLTSSIICQAEQSKFRVSVGYLGITIAERMCPRPHLIELRVRLTELMCMLRCDKL